MAAVPRCESMPPGPFTLRGEHRKPVSGTPSIRPKRRPSANTAIATATDHSFTATAIAEPNRRGVEQDSKRIRVLGYGHLGQVVEQSAQDCQAHER
jgi:hypothetical protein